MRKRSLVLSLLKKAAKLFDGNICRFATCVFLGILIRKNKNKKSRLGIIARTSFILTESDLSLEGCSPAKPFSVSSDADKSKDLQLKRK